MHHLLLRGNNSECLYFHEALNISNNKFKEGIRWFLTLFPELCHEWSTLRTVITYASQLRFPAVVLNKSIPVSDLVWYGPLRKGCLTVSFKTGHEHDWGFFNVMLSSMVFGVMKHQLGTMGHGRNQGGGRSGDLMIPPPRGIDSSRKVDWPGDLPSPAISHRRDRPGHIITKVSRCHWC